MNLYMSIFGMAYPPTRVPIISKVITFYTSEILIDSVI